MTPRRTSALAASAAFLALAGCPSRPSDVAADASTPPPPPPSASAPAPSAPASVSPPGTPPAEAFMHCFSWIHLSEHSVDCYRTPDECEAERLRMVNGARPATPCAPRKGASCTRISRPPEHPDPWERCFGDRGACERYRRFVTRSGAVTGACEGP